MCHPQDSQFEARVQKLVKAEVTQKLRVLELEKAQVVLRCVVFPELTR